MLQPEVLYTVREGGELSEGETHWLTQNNPVLLPTGQAMMMTMMMTMVMTMIKTRSSCQLARP